MTFGSFNRISKISREVVALWSQLLRSLPGSRMLLGGAPDKFQCTDILQWFANEGIVKERISIYPRCDIAGYLTLHHQIDLCLDTFPYSGGSTTWQALWMGVPTLTMGGETPFGRAGAAKLGRIGLEDHFTARNAQDFTQLALDWAAKPEELNQLRLQMRERFRQSIVGQPAQLAAGLDTALRTMWQRWCSGLPAAHF
jgi:predicted O-linked N-acetylglucosamine transferase (SPINDLY family)